MKKNIKKAKDGVTGVTRFTRERGSSYPVEKKVEYDTTGYSTGKKMFSGTKTETFKSGEKKTTPMTGDRKSVDIVIKNPIKYEGQQTQKTKTPATGSNIRKYMSPSVKLPLTEQTVKANKTGKATPSTSPSPSSAPVKSEEKKTGGGGGERRRAASNVSRANTPTGSEPKKVTRTVAAEFSAPKRELGKFSAPGIQKGPEKRKFSDTQIKIMEAMQKEKQADGTMSASAQMKIKSLKEKEKMANMKAERQKNKSNNKALRKSVRAGKFNARQVRKSAK